MFGDYQEDYTSSSQSSCPSLSDSNSNGSFYSWDAASITPPPSARQASLESMKLENMPLCSTNTSDGYGIPTSMSSLSSMDYGTGSGFTEQGIVFPEDKMQDHSMMGFNNFPSFSNEDLGSFHSNHGLPINTPALETDLPSPVSVNFVVPSQTTFSNSFEMHSPVRLLQFNSPASDFHSSASLDHSPIGDINFCLQYEDCKSASTTPSRAQPSCRSSILRQPISGPAWTSAALQRVQSDSHTVRQKQKRARRDVSRGMKIAHNMGVRVQPAADKPCLWPGCSRKFKRQEHLKRHEKTHKPGTPEICPFCNHEFKGSRGDNLKTHVELHDKPNSKRTPYDERASAWLEAREKERRKKKGKEMGEGLTREEVKIEDTPSKPKSRFARY